MGIQTDTGALPRVTWAVVQQLLTGQLPTGVARDVAMANGLDLPHQPGILRVPGRGDVESWAVHCIGCTFETAQIQPRCRMAYWHGPAVLVDALELRAALDDLAAELRARPELAA